MLLWVIAGSGLLLALLAYLRSRRLAVKLDGLTHSYWELRYEHGKLRAQVARLDPAQPPTALEPPPPSSTAAFVPLASLKKG